MDDPSSGPQKTYWAHSHHQSAYHSYKWRTERRIEIFIDGSKVTHVCNRASGSIFWEDMCCSRPLSVFTSSPNLEIIHSVLILLHKMLGLLFGMAIDSWTGVKHTTICITNPISILEPTRIIPTYETNSHEYSQDAWEGGKFSTLKCGGFHLLLGCGYPTTDRGFLGYVAFAPYIADVLLRVRKVSCYY